ncbi:MAG: GNAT family N-acetyltransferase [Oscillospiraceae bacterium]|jgi:ribosomal protein S18 acetylase RimI-like enzyme
MKLEFVAVKTEAQIDTLAKIADEIWHEHFSAILSPEQIDYMVDVFQSYSAINEQLKKLGYSYYFLEADSNPIGYIGLKQENNKLFLSKLYILKEYRGKGYASRAFEFLEEMCREKHLKAIWLTVNRNNETPIKVYEKKGFVTIREQVSDIGNGFVMDDFVMEKEI